ncbi:hypothetical protein MARGE09_P1920 [Marinagarivorans cellulosilyticus]|uniref:Uncharacterized protein n=2 Tax=Marinagarivorans cellulosilyticus TaxID=2721545 RepID=A0AAN1WHJ0_9GAMM|nr:hypothetical protein MARGE09_P1920 [Marinagarivorans cellulosilyticus]
MVKFTKEAIETTLSALAIFLAIGWVIFPDANFEPVIVLLLLVIGFVPIYQHQIHPWWDSYRLQKQGFKYLRGSGPMNAIEGDFAKFSSGLSFRLKSQKVPNYPVYARVFFEQTNLRLEVYFSDGEKVDLSPSFDIGSDTDSEVCLPKESNQYILAQVDLDDDGLDEIVFGVIESLECESKVHVLVFKYHPPYLKKDVGRYENWRIFPAANATGVHGDPIVHLESGVISIPRNFRSMEYKWAFVDGQQVYVGSA